MLKEFLLGLGSGTWCLKTRVMGLPGRTRSLTISSAKWIECTNVKDGQTTAKTTLTHSVAWVKSKNMTELHKPVLAPVYKSVSSTDTVSIGKPKQVSKKCNIRYYTLYRNHTWIHTEKCQLKRCVHVCWSACRLLWKTLLSYPT